MTDSLFLEPEHEQLRDQIRRFVEEEIKPHADAWEETGMVPREVLTRMGELGFFGIRYPDRYGGAEMDTRATTVWAEELGRSTFSGVAITALVHTDMASVHLFNAGTDAQRDRWMPGISSGQTITAVAVTEPGAGSDVRGMSCNAVRDGGDWVVNGSKHFISGADHADFFIVFVATGVDETPKGPKKRITTFLVDRGTPGFDVRDGYNSVSHKGYKNCILSFDDCRLSDAQVLGEVDGGFAVMNEWLYATRLTVAAFSVGRARRCFDYALNYAAERKQFGQPIGNFQLMQGKIADMYRAMNSSRAYIYAVAKACDRGDVTRQDAAACCLYASEEAMKQAHQAVQAMGGAGFLSDSPVSRIFRDAKLMEIGAGTSEIRRMLVGRELMNTMG